MQMQIVDFKAAHIEQAAQIAKQNYENERGHVPALPPIDTVPDLTLYVENGLGVAAFVGNMMIGFLCTGEPFKKVFRSTDAVGIFSPMGANGAVGENRANIYAYMYQAAGGKWARAGASSHAVCLYAHDAEAQAQFFRYGFGLRCLDAIREMEDIAAPQCDGYDFYELAADEALDVLPLENMLHRSFLESPFFLFRAEHSETEWMEYWNRCHPICFAVKYENQNIAFILAEIDGENFIRDTEGYIHISGLFCLPEHRGKGISQKLLNLLVQKLRADGYMRLGVDFESINPSGFGFWSKYFTAYTHSVVRRIDEYSFFCVR